MWSVITYYSTAALVRYINTSEQLAMTFVFTVEVKTPVNQQQLNTDTIKMQSSPAYIPVGQDNDPISSIVPQYDTVQVPSDHQDVPMMANPAYLTHKNI